MHIVRSPQLITMVDQPGLQWLLAGMFGLGGTVSTLAPWLFAEPITFPAMMGLVGMGLASIAAGIYVFQQSPRSTVTIDMSRREIRIRRSSIFGIAHWRAPFHDVAAIDLELADNESSPCWRPRLHMKDGRSIPLSRLYDFDRVGQEEVVDVVKAALQ